MRNHCWNNINRLSKGGFCFLIYFGLTLLGLTYLYYTKATYGKVYESSNAKSRLNGRMWPR